MTDARPKTSEALPADESRRALPSLVERVRDARPHGLRHVKPLLILAAAALTCASLALAREVLIPVAFASLLALVLTPLVDFVQRRGVHRIGAVVIVVVLVFSILGTVVGMLAQQVATLANDLP